MQGVPKIRKAILITITTDSLPDGKVGVKYSQTLIVTGSAPITWSIGGGDLPAGLRLNRDTSEISGTPTAAGTAAFTVKAENIAVSDTRELSIKRARHLTSSFGMIYILKQIRII